MITDHVLTLLNQQLLKLNVCLCYLCLIVLIISLFKDLDDLDNTQKCTFLFLKNRIMIRFLKIKTGALASAH